MIRKKNIESVAAVPLFKFNVENFLSKRGIHYITSGVNVKAGEINLSCPFCNSEGNPDPSHHLGIDPKNGFWSCWRNRRHHGRKLHRLLMKLLRISYAEACQILGEQVDWIQEGSFDALAKDPSKIFVTEQQYLEAEQDAKGLDLPEDFVKIGKYNSSKRFINYLIYERGFHKLHVDDLIDTYDLHCCLSGKWENRLIWPIYQDFRLVTWTGRSIQKETSLRYNTFSPRKGALMSIKDTVYNFDDLMDAHGDVLFVTEGPFDALKVDFYGKDVGARATCLFSKTLREPQAILIEELSMNFKKIVLLLDVEEVDTALKMTSALAFLTNEVIPGELPEGFGDPGDLTPSAIYKLVDSLV